MSSKINYYNANQWVWQENIVNSELLGHFPDFTCCLLSEYDYNLAEHWL